MTITIRVRPNPNAQINGEQQQPQPPRRSLWDKFVSIFACSQEPPKSLDALRVEVRAAKRTKEEAENRYKTYEQEFSEHHKKRIEFHNSMIDANRDKNFSGYVNASMDENHERIAAQEALNSSAIAAADVREAAAKEKALEKQIAKLTPKS
jgi:hypothetical protein